MDSESALEFMKEATKLATSAELENIGQKLEEKSDLFNSILNPEDISTMSEDDFKKNLKAYQRLTGNQLNQKCLPNNGWVGWRAISPDRNPYVGQVLNTSKELTKNPKSLNDLNWHPNLFVNTGYGSRGYTLAPFVSKCLASKIDASQTAEEEDILNYLNPCRGSLKKLGLRKKIFLNSI